MASTLKPLSPIPPQFVPVIDPRSGKMNTDWYLYFKRLDEHLREVEQRVTALE